jgi:hypothetical protein
MFILRHADHQHFADEIDEPGLCAPEKGGPFSRGLGLAHFDAVLKDNDHAARFMANAAARLLRERGPA